MGREVPVTGLDCMIVGMSGKTMIITLCGSTQFKPHFERLERELSLEGHIVFSLPVFSRYDDIKLDSEQETTLIDLHMKKIKYSDLVWVVCPGDYIGRHTQDEIDYAIAIGLTVKYDNRGL